MPPPKARSRSHAGRSSCDHAALVSDATITDERARVTLMTLHSAKGLEFDQGVPGGHGRGPVARAFPERRRRHRRGQRRLCYVGMTRARDRLVLSGRGSGAPTVQAAEPSRRSRFLDEVPKTARTSSLGSAGKARTTWEKRRHLRPAWNACCATAAGPGIGPRRRGGRRRRVALHALENRQQGAARGIWNRHGARLRG